MLACRACRRPLTAAEGCAICATVKANLVTTEENAEEFPALSDVSSETVAALSAVLKKHRATMKNTKAKLEDIEFAETAVIRVANTLAKVLESARKLQTDGLAAVRNMSFTDRATLFADWYQTLPPMYRTKVRLGMTQFEGQVSAPVPALSAGDDNGTAAGPQSGAHE
jgi:uncharacterized Zn finger protein (UPF0148 family)